jgi:serine/threonine protein phosphatase PrpC
LWDRRPPVDERSQLALPMEAVQRAFVSVSRTHIGLVRPANEDALAERRDISLWAVSDGMGGGAAGNVASGLVVDSLMRVACAERDPVLVVRQALAEANAEIYRRAGVLSPAAAMGATVAVLGAEQTRFFCLWAGDSRLYRFRTGIMSRITRDHRYIQSLLDAGILDEEAAEKHPHRNIITRAVGINEDLELDCIQGKIEPGDLFLLTTDGVTAVCRDHELSAIISAFSLENAADRIVSTCLERGAPDNLSLVLIERRARGERNL